MNLQRIFREIREAASLSSLSHQHLAHQRYRKLVGSHYLCALKRSLATKEVIGLKRKRQREQRLAQEEVSHRQEVFVEVFGVLEPVAPVDVEAGKARWVAAEAGPLGSVNATRVGR